MKGREEEDGENKIKEGRSPNEEEKEEGVEK